MTVSAYTLREENMLFRRKGPSKRIHIKLLLKSQAALQRTVTKQIEVIYMTLKDSFILQFPPQI